MNQPRLSRCEAAQMSGLQDCSDKIAALQAVRAQQDMPAIELGKQKHRQRAALRVHEARAMPKPSISKGSLAAITEFLKFFLCNHAYSAFSAANSRAIRSLIILCFLRAR